MTPDLISIVVPACDEAASLPALFDEIDAAMKSIGKTFEVIVVDDGSRDNSWAVIIGRSAKDARYRGIRLRRNFGKAAALTVAFQSVRGGVVLMLDADLQDDPAEIPRFLAALDGGLDVVSGWKKVRHDPWHKVLPSRVFNAMISTFTGVKLHDHNCGFKAMRAEVARSIRIDGGRYRFIPVLAAAQGWRYGELIIQHRPRKHGRSHYGVGRFAKGFLDLIGVSFLTRFGRRPLHAFGLPGLASIVFGKILLVVMLFGLLFNWPGAMSVILLAILGSALVISGLILLAGGLLAELIADRAATPVEYNIAETIPARPTP